jgi:hypothetical protein
MPSGDNYFAGAVNRCIYMFEYGSVVAREEALLDEVAYGCFFKVLSKEEAVSDVFVCHDVVVVGVDKFPFVCFLSRVIVHLFNVDIIVPHYSILVVIGFEVVDKQTSKVCVEFVVDLKYC